MSLEETNAYWERHEVAWSTIHLAMEDRIQAKYTAVTDVKELWQKPKDDNTETTKLGLWRRWLGMEAWNWNIFLSSQ